MRSRSRARDSASAPSVPFVGWTELQAHLARTWKPGQHVTCIGKAGSGKTHLALELVDMRPYSIIAASKRHDPIMDAAISRGYKLVDSMKEIPMTETGRPVYRRVVVWPGGNIESEKHRQALQAFEFRNMLSTAERQRHWTVLIDETMWFYDMLQLKKELDAQWYQARSSGISLIACAQRPIRVPRLMISQASHLFIFYVSDKRDLEPLREIGGRVAPEVIETVLPSLDAERHEFLYIGADSGYIARSIAPPR